MKSDEKYIKKIKVIAEADIRCGNKTKLERTMIRLIQKEDYETCEGIQRALDDEILLLSNMKNDN